MKTSELQAVVTALREVSVSLDLTETLEAVLDGVKTLLPFNAAGIYVVDPASRELVAMAERGYPTTQQSSGQKAQRVLNGVFGRGGGLTPDVSAEPTYLEKRHATKTEMSVPIVGSRRRVIGGLNIESDVAGSYEPGSPHLLELFASGIAGAIERALLHSEILRARHLEQELAFARDVMKGLIPKELPKITGIELGVDFRPRFDVGGDYYDFIPIDDERWGIVIADVAGKGVAAALLVSALRAALHNLARNELALRSVLRKANRFFRESSEEGKYATTFYAELDTATQRLIYINAGHPPPVLIRKDGRAEYLETGGTPIGLFADARYVEGFAQLDAGDVLALYTDGVMDAVDGNEESFGRQRISDVLCSARAGPAAEIVSAVVAAVERFAESEELDDDRTVLVMKAI